MIASSHARFSYDADLEARREIELRLAETGRRRGLITYSDSVRGITFHLPNVPGGAGIQLGLPEWTDLHRAIIGSYLGLISCDSYAQAGFLSSAIAVSAATHEPSEGFRALVRDIGLAGYFTKDSFLRFWLEQVRMAHDWYSAQARSATRK